LLVEVATGVVSFVVALIVVDRELIREVVAIAAQAIPGGRRLARRLGVSQTAATIDEETETDEAAIAEEAAEAEEAAIAEEESPVDISDVASGARRRDFDDV
jgi:hypothetical protein